MKKKLCLGLLFTSFACLTLASCNNGYESIASKEVDTSKDFDLEKPEPLSSAKLLSQDEKVEYISKNSNPDLDAIYANAKNKYKTMVLLYQSKNLQSEEGFNYSKIRYVKTLFDLNTGNAWYYEKYNEELEEDGKKGTASFELETKVVNKDGNYIVRSTMDLNNYCCYHMSGKFQTEYGENEGIIGSAFATGHANIYTLVPSNGLVLNFDNQYIKERIKGTNGVYTLARDNKFSLYVNESNNYAYYKAADGMWYDITITADNYYGKYINVNSARIQESHLEIYFSDKRVLDDEIDIYYLKELFNNVKQHKSK